MTFMRNRMNDNRTIEITSTSKGEFQFGFIVTIDWSDVLETQILKHPLGSNYILHALFHSMKGFIDRSSHDRCLVQHTLTPTHYFLVTWRGTQ